MDLDRDVLARPECTADAGEDQADLVLRESQARRDLIAIDVQPLRRDVQRDAAVAVGDREAALRTERGLVLHRDLVLALDDDLGGRSRIPVDDAYFFDDVAAPMQLRCVAAEGRDRIGDQRQGLVVDPDGPYRRACLLRVLGRDDGDGLADEADDVLGQRGLVGVLEPEEQAAGHVGVRQDGGDARHRLRGRDVDGHDARVRMRRSKGLAVQHPLGVKVAGVGELTRDFRHAIWPLRRLADDAEPDALTGPRRRAGHRPRLIDTSRATRGARLR